MTDQTPEVNGNHDSNGGHAMDAKPLPAAKAGVARSAKSVRHARIAASMTIAALLAGGAAYRALSQTQPESPKLMALVPASTQFVFTARPDYFWKLTSSIRALPQVQQPLTTLQQKLGITYESDIEPWAGQVAVYGGGFETDHPDGAFLIQIRDADAFNQFFTKIRPKLEEQSKSAWTSREYDGVTYQVISDAALPKSPTVKTGAPDGPPVIATLNGWIAVAMGEPAMKKLLDTYTGKATPIQAAPNWTQALSHTPPEGVVSGAMDFGAFMKMAAKQSKAYGAPATPMMPNADYMNFVVSFTFNDKDNVLRTDMVTSPESERLRTLYKRYAAKLHPVTGASLQKIPDATGIVILTNPAFLARQEVALLPQAATTAHERNEMARSIKKMQPYLDITDHFTGEAAFAMTFNPDKGFGLAAVAQADQPAAALRAARVLARTLSQSGAPIAKTGTTWSMPSLSVMSPIPSLPLNPTITAQDRWLEISSHPFWIKSAGRTPSLQIPAEAAGSPYVGVGNMKWVPAVLDLVEKSLPSKDDDAKHGLAVARGLHLENASWTYWGSADPSGSYNQATYEVRGWSLKDAIDNTVNEISAWYLPRKANGNADVTQAPVAHKTLRG